jgi:hypothetical protein
MEPVIVEATPLGLLGTEAAVRIGSAEISRSFPTHYQHPRRVLPAGVPACRGPERTRYVRRTGHTV